MSRKSPALNLYVSILLVFICQPLRAQPTGNWQFAGPSEYQFDGFFGSDTLVQGGHGIAVDKFNRIWVGNFFNSLRVMNPNGTEASFSPIDSVTVGERTIATAGNRGLAIASDGNIISSHSAGILLKIDVESGEGMALWEDVAGNPLLKAAVDADGYIYVGRVVGISPISVLDPEFFLDIEQIVLDRAPFFGRGLEVTADGLTILTPDLGNDGGPVSVWTSNDFLTYTKTDSIFTNTEGELIFKTQRQTFDWGPDSTLWVSLDNSGEPSNISANGLVILDFNTKSYKTLAMPPISGNGPRGVAFSATGDTAYAISWNANRIFRFATRECDPLDCAGAAIFPTSAGGALGEQITGFQGDTICVDLRLKENPNEIYAFGFQVRVNPNHLSFVQTSIGDLTKGFVAVDGQENTPGEITVGGFGANPIPIQSEGILARLYFEVNCQDGDMSEITISSLSDDVSGFTACCNTFECAVCLHDGDVNGDEVLSPGDALCAFQIFLNGQELNSDCDVERFDCEVIAADVSCDATVTPGDAWSIFMRSLSAEPPEDCFAEKESATAKPRTGSTNISLRKQENPESEQSLDPNLMRVSLMIDNSYGLDAFGLRLSYPEDKVEFIRLERSVLTADWIEEDAKLSGPGELIVGGFNDKPLLIETQSALFHILFATKDHRVDVAEFQISNLVDDLSGGLVGPISLTPETPGSIPTSFNLYQNYPNPFNPETHIRFDIPSLPGDVVRVRLLIYNTRGQVARVLLDEERSPGAHEAEWNGNTADGVQVPSGVYFYTIDAGDFTETKKMLLLK